MDNCATSTDYSDYNYTCDEMDAYDSCILTCTESACETGLSNCEVGCLSETILSLSLALLALIVVLVLWENWYKW